ncbi:MAG: hypothetical protein ACI86M_002154 [Saprospiraceae bacterium]|jgi:hypothetical protein
MQNKLLPIVLNSVSTSLGAEVEAKSLDVDFFEEISLNHIYIEGANGDTLVYAEALNVDISLFSLFNKTFFVDDIRLSGGIVHLNDKNGEANYQHILDHLAKPKSSDTNSETSDEGWRLGLDDIILDDMILTMLGSTSDMMIDIPHLVADLAAFPESFDTLSFNMITSDDLKFSLIERTPSENTGGKTKFPTLPFYLDVTDLNLNNASIVYDKMHMPKKANGFDANHIDITETNLIVKNLKWKNEISGEIQGLNLKDQSGMEIQNLTTKLTVSDKKIDLENLIISTSESTLKVSIKSEYASFDELVNNFTQQKITADVRQGDISKNDIVQFIDPYQISFIDLTRINRIKYSGILSTENGKIAMSRTSLNIDNNFSASGYFSFSAGRNASYSAKLNNINTTQDYLTSLFPGFMMPSEIKNLGKIKGLIHADGNSKKIKIHDINLDSGEDTIIIGRGEITRLDYAPDIWLDLYFDELKMNPQNVLQGESIPSQLYNLGDIDYVGAIKGNATNITMEGVLQTGIGDAELDASVEFKSNYSDATYKGDFDLDGFDLGRLLQDTTFGIVTVSGVIDGSGLNLETLNASLDVKAEKIEYAGDSFEDITVKGIYSNSTFTGRVISNDDKIKLNFDGLADLNGADSKIEFTSEIERFDLTQFGIGDSLLWVSGLVSGTMKGNTVDNFIGKGSIENLKIATQNGVYKSESILSFIATENDGDSKVYQMESSFLDARAEGSIKLSELGSVLEEYFKNYIPIAFGYEESEAVDTTLFEHQNFALDVRTKDINPILEVLLDKEVKLKNANLTGNFSSDNSKIDFKGGFDNLIYNGYVVESGNYFFDGRKDFINGNIILDNITDGKDILIHEVNIIADLNNRVANLNVELFDENDEQTLLIGGNISRTTEYVLNFHDKIIINQSEWQFSPYNAIAYGDEGLYMQDVSISKDKQSITAYTDENKNGHAIELLMDNFILSEFTSIIKTENEYFEGEINGAAVINNVWGKPFITADVSMNKIKLQDYDVGKVTVEAVQNTETNTVVTKMELKGPYNDATLDLTYGIGDGSINGFLDMTRLDMTTLDPFLTNILTDSEGKIRGRIKIGGTTSKPRINGKVDLIGVQTTPVFTNSRYAILDQTVTIDEEAISFGDMVIFDEKNNIANLTGEILHTNLSEMYLDLSIDTDEFLFLNTTPVENSLFYGNVTVQANVSIQGPVKDVKIDGTAEVVNNSRLSISPFSIDQLDYETDFIIYADPRKISLDSLNARANRSGNTLPFDLDLELTVSEDSEFEMVMDPITGDNITGKGNANLIFNLRKTGEIELFGTYTVTEGKYLFTYGPIAKEFDIQEGGRVIFNGNPLHGTLDVKAVYESNTAVYDLLIQEIGVDAADNVIADTKRKRDVDVILNLSNSIAKPEIKMDITYDPSDIGENSEVSDMIIRKLQTLRSDPNELNNQVFGLLLFDNFILASNADTDLAQTGTNLAINSLSGLVTNQLNKLASGLIKGVELNFDVNSYSSDFTSTGDAGLVTELGVGVSKQLFNDRLTLSAGTNVDLESNSTAALFNNLAGDFIIAYKLTEDGTYNIKVFRKSNYDTILDENSSKNGVGFNVRTEFGTIKKKSN